MSTLTISEVADKVRAVPAPVIIIDTCSLLDLFRFDSNRDFVPAQEVQAATDLLQLVQATPANVHLAVPELVPKEFSDNADLIQTKSGKWLEIHDRNQSRLFAMGGILAGTSFPTPPSVVSLDLQTKLRKLSEDLLAKAIVLGRDQACLEKAVGRVIAGKMPSNKGKEIKDSMNLEQSLELSTRLKTAGFLKTCVFVSSNTNDFAEGGGSSRIHADLLGDFTKASLEYFTSLHAAVGAVWGSSPPP